MMMFAFRFDNSLSNRNKPTDKKLWAGRPQDKQNKQKRAGFSKKPNKERWEWYLCWQNET